MIFHAVAQRPRNRVETFAVAMKNDAAQVERHVEIVVGEGRVLLGIEHLEQRRRRVAVQADAELVHLVQHQHAIARPGLAHGLDDVARHRADIRAAMPADLGFVMHAARSSARYELAARAPARCSGRATSCRRREGRRSTGSGCGRRIELAHREVLEDAPLDLLEAVVVRVEDLARLRRWRWLPRRASTTAARPANRGTCAPSNAPARRPDMLRQAPQLLASLLLDLLGHLGVRNLPRRSSSSSDCVSSSPSSFLIVFNCSRSTYSRWRSSSLPCVCSPISRDSRAPRRGASGPRDAIEPIANFEALEKVLLLGRLDVDEPADHVGERARRLDVL